VDKNSNMKYSFKTTVTQTSRILCLQFLIAVLMASFSSAAFAVVTLKIATVSPDGATWMVKMREGAKVIKKRTEGRVRFKFYPGGVMGNDASVLRKIRIGQLHGGAVTGGSLYKIAPDTQLYQLPFLFNSQDEVDYVRAKIDSKLIKKLDSKGFVTFGFAGAGFAYFMSNNPVSSVADLQKQKVWLPIGDKVNHLVFDEASISPIPLPISDVMTSLQTGLIDTVAASPIVAISLQWHTKIKYVMRTPASYIYALLAVNKRAFNRIKPEDQAIVREIMAKVFTEIDAQNRLSDKQAVEAMEQQGIQFVDITKNDIIEWKRIAANARNQMISKGAYTKDLVEQINSGLKEYRQLHQSKQASR
jgi:TRAP-type C4-dicarboxylate transport system substrate-binding protein